MHLRQAGLRDDAERVLECPVVLGGKADDDVAREVEVLAQRLEPAQVGADGVAPSHRLQDAVVARLERHVQVTARGRRLAERAN